MRSLLCGFVIASCGLMPSLKAFGAIVIVENLIQADFTFTATDAGAQIFPAPAGVPLALRARGNMAFAIDDDGVSSTAAFTNATGQLTGISPTPPDLLPFYIEPVRFDGGTLTNITRDGNGRIASGTVTDLAMPWEMIGTGANAGVVLYGDQATTPLLFSGTFNINHNTPTPSLTLDDQVAGADPFNIYLLQAGDRENQVPGADPLVFVGSNRFLTAVPEPSSASLLLFAAGLAAFRRRRSAAVAV
ncbi:hypothetical protein Q31a_16700 [Aureliella helgolandensis]|uniref:Ice-binding protein C-terminal domain-containing protein n=2 Tax=Aureliella helgolandensis TaxID=2527968 RepID=A0A518G454_9BACT|nr:hypothetical protein Q31a_16700 [Aureliella helgolandensis]